MSSESNPGDQAPSGDPVDDLLAECLAYPATDVASRIRTLCELHPPHAAELRRRYEKLLTLGMVDASAGDAPPRGPDRLGHFRLIRQISAGGMGVVYEAQDERLDRRVALKVIREAQRFFVGARERFAREMRAASRLDHPNLCPMYEAGEVDDVPYIAMRFIDGKTLAQLLEERRKDQGGTPHRSSNLLRQDVVRWLEKVASALHAAHEAGVVHRDVKPANIVIDSDGEPVLVDFGLARDGESSLDALTHSGDRLGTPAYMAPEQVSGSRAIDRRTDVYGLGVTLYEGLTQRLPFESPAREHLFQQILTSAPRDPRAYDRGISGELAVVVGKALEKSPGARFATANEMAEELRRIRQHEPILSRRPGLGLRLVRWSQRNRAAASILCATVVGLVVSLGLLRRSWLAEARAKQSITEFRALAWLQAAGEIEEHDPELAFQYAREALRLHEDPLILAKAQSLTFGLRERTVLDHGGTFASFSPDGRLIVVTGPGLPARLFRREGGDWLETALKDTGWRGASQLHPPPAVFSPDSRELALRGLKSGVVHRYDLLAERSEALESLQGPADPDTELWSVSYHPDASDPRLLVVHSRLTRVWSRSGEHLHDLPRPENTSEWVRAAFLPNGHILAAGALWSPDGNLLRTLPRFGAVWHVLVGTQRFILGTTNELRAFDFAGDPVGSPVVFPERDLDDLSGVVLMDPARTLLVRATHRGLIQVFSAESLALEGQWSMQGRLPFPPSLSRDGLRIAACDDRGTLGVWTLDGLRLETVRGLGSGSTLDWSPRGHELVSASGTGRSTSVWRLEALRGVPAYAGLGRPDVAVSPSGQTVVFSSDARGSIYHCDAGGRLLSERHAELGRSHLRFLCDERVVISSESDRRLLVWETANGDQSRPLHEVMAPVALGLSAPLLLPDGRWLLSEFKRPRSKTWRPGERAAVIPHSTWGKHSAVSPTGEHVILAGYGAAAWAPPEAGTTRPLEMNGVANFVAFSRDGLRVLAASSDSHAYLWDVASLHGSPRRLSGHESPLVCAAFSLDGGQIATAAQDGSIRIWDSLSHETRLTLEHEGIRRLAFTATGQLVSAGDDGTVRWWTLHAGLVRDAIEELDIPELDEAQRWRVRHVLGQ